MTSPYVLGITGNIATGKSTVAQMLAALGAEHIDCDVLAHEAMAPGLPANAAVAARFAGVQRADGTIDRQALGRIVFDDPQALADLEALTHPAVLAEVARRVAASSAPVVVVEAIKLFESGLDELCTAVWAVTATKEAQLQRLMEQRHLEYDEAERRITAQPDPAEKVARADRVIDNSGSLRHTWRQVLAGWRAIPGAPQPGAHAPLPAAWRQEQAGQWRRWLLCWAALAAFCCVWTMLNWINAELTLANKAAILGAVVLVCGACSWVVLRW